MPRSIELPIDELDNYGIIISNSIPQTTDIQIKIDDIVKKGVEYIYSNLIEPLQEINKFITVKQLRKREILGRTSSERSKPNTYDLYALKMNDFDDLLNNPEHHIIDHDDDDDDDNNIDKSKLLSSLFQNEDKLRALFNLLKHIKNNGLYYYQSSQYINDNYAMLYINELRKVNYEYLIFISNNNNNYYNISLTELLESFEIFKQKLRYVNLEDLTICSLAKERNVGAYGKTKILNFSPIIKTDRPFIQRLIYAFMRSPLLSNSSHYKKTELLNKIIYNIDLIELFQKIIFSVDKKNIYFIKDDVTEFLKTKKDKTLSITYDIRANLHLQQRQIFTD